MKEFNIPLVPFEPVSVREVPSGDQFVAQIKWDGVRMLSCYDGMQVKLFNRKLNERTMQYPELTEPSVYCRSSSYILDGELIAFDESKPSFHEIMKRDSVRKLQSIDQARHRTPITYMVFDVLFIDGKWVTDRTLEQRQRMLNDIILPCEQVQVVRNFDNPAQLLEVMRAHQMEGIVCKQKHSLYSIAGKDRRWQKIKLSYDLHAIVGGITIKHHVVNTIVLGLYDEQGALVCIGHAGIGKLSEGEKQELTQRLVPDITAEMPFSLLPDRYQDVLWVKPQLVVKVQYMEFTPHRTMRQPIVQAVVQDVPASLCTFEQLN